MAQKNIQSVLHEERPFPPPAHFAEHASPDAAELERMYAKAHDRLVVTADGGWRGGNPVELKSQDISTLENPSIIELLRADRPGMRTKQPPARKKPRLRGSGRSMKRKPRGKK